MAGKGCHHPFRGSNTWLLEENGWTGIAIDANPLGHLFEGKRSRTRFFQALLWSAEGEELSFSSMEGSAFDGVEHTLGLHKGAHAKGGAALQTMKTRTLASVLDEAGAPEELDFVSLDVEGAELEVLAAFPFERYRMRVLSVEHNHEEPKRGDIAKLLQSHGYVLAAEVFFAASFIPRCMLFCCRT